MQKQVLLLMVGVLMMVALAGCSQSQSAESNQGDASNSNSPNLTNSQVKMITADDVLALEDGAYLVDTRTYDEYAEGHIPGALNASYPKSTGGPCQTAENSASFRTEWAKLDIPKDAHVVLYCRTGTRASAAASALMEDGYTNVEMYEGNWTEWGSDPSLPKETV